METHCSFVLDYMRIANWSYIHLQRLLPIFPMIPGIHGNFQLQNMVYSLQLFAFQSHIFCGSNRKLSLFLRKPKQ